MKAILLGALWVGLGVVLLVWDLKLIHRALERLCR